MMHQCTYVHEFNAAAVISPSTVQRSTSDDSTSTYPSLTVTHGDNDIQILQPCKRAFMSIFPKQ